MSVHTVHSTVVQPSKGAFVFFSFKRMEEIILMIFEQHEFVTDEEKTHQTNSISYFLVGRVCWIPVAMRCHLFFFNLSSQVERFRFDLNNFRWSVIRMGYTEFSGFRICIELFPAFENDWRLITRIFIGCIYLSSTLRGITFWANFNRMHRILSLFHLMIDGYCYGG